MLALAAESPSLVDDPVRSYEFRQSARMQAGRRTVSLPIISLAATGSSVRAFDLLITVGMEGS